MICGSDLNLYNFFRLPNAMFFLMFICGVMPCVLKCSPRTLPEFVYGM